MKRFFMSRMDATMADNVDPAKRSLLMAGIRGKDTAPERAVRQGLHALGYRYRLHGKGLPGRPDLVFPRRRKVVFVHGCFWHGHEGCRYAHVPKTRSQYWQDKFDRNKARDARQVAELGRLGWEAFVAWECEVRTLPELLARLVDFLGPPRPVEGRLRQPLATASAPGINAVGA